jgi:histidyl-tRNA synthetase
MANKYQSVRGMNDVLPEESVWWQYVEQVITEWTDCYGYRQIRTPILESTELFVRSIGEVTDIVEKEMYTFVDRLNNESMTLRPEGTAACLRAALQHNLLYNQNQRLWYIGPMFRHERPQKGRYRQFHQVGIETIGFEGPDADAEVIAMTHDLWQRLGLKQVRLEINSLGNKEERLQHREKLIAYLEQHQDVLDEEGRRRLYTNPLRVLDSKNPAMQEIAKHAPQLLDYLGEASRAHFEGLCALLAHLNIAYTINPRLVRGLDYYNLTVFEWVTDTLGAQGTVCAGGRYNGLIEELGGKATPAVGFAMGIERLLLLMQQEQVFLPQSAPDVYIVRQGDEAIRFAFTVAQTLRQAGKKVILHCGEGNFKSQMKKADASGAYYAVIIGDDEVQQQRVILKPLRTGKEQIAVTAAELVHHI